MNQTTWELLCKIYQGGPRLFSLDFDQANNFYISPSVGLYNEDKYQFLNQSLQALFSIDEFIVYFLRRNYRVKERTQRLCETLTTTLEDIRATDQTGFYNAIQLKFYVEEQFDIRPFPFDVIRHLLAAIKKETRLEGAVQAHKIIKPGFNKHDNHDFVQKLFQNIVIKKKHCVFCHREEETQKLTNFITLLVDKAYNYFEDLVFANLV